MTTFSDNHQRLFLALVEEAVEVARRKGKMTELDALLGLQTAVAMTTEALVGSLPAALGLRTIADGLEERARDPVRLPKKNIVDGSSDDASRKTRSFRVIRDDPE